MLRCTYRLTATRTRVARAMLERLPHAGDRVTLNNQAYVVETVTQEGATATVSVSMAS